MERLTKKSSMFGYGYGDGDESRKYNRNNCSDTSNIPEIINKLGQLEDIEQELGIDLITLFKALRDGICGNDYYWSMGMNKGHIYIGDKCLVWANEYGEIEKIFYFKDYGKTWALTKEELVK